jgi:hypothetical protein
MVDMLGSRGGVDHAGAKVDLVLALSSLSREEDRTRSSLWKEHAELVAPCRPSLSDAEVAGNLWWRKAEVGKSMWHRSLGKARELTG